MSEYRWPYLHHPAFDTRYAIAASWLRGCKSTLEIGGWRLHEFLQGPKVTCVDPASPISTRGTLTVVKGPIEEYRGEHDGVCLLGLGFDGPPLAASGELMLKADAAVVEMAFDWKPCGEYFNQLLYISKKKVELTIDMDLSANNIVSKYRVREKRRIYLLK